MAKNITQTQQVIDTLRAQGGYSTLGNLYHLVDTSAWATKTPNESIRRIVQQSNEIFRIQPGLWALEECREEVLRKFEIETKEAKDEERFKHGYYQGLIIEIGNMKNYRTYVPAQDKNRKFLEKPLVEICTTVHLPAIGRWEKSCGKHPTQKPLGVLARLIQASTPSGAWILDPFSGSATTGIAANLLGRKYLGLEIEDDFLSMSKARREGIENCAVRNDYLERLAKAKIILPPDNFFMADETDINYGVPWL